MKAERRWVGARRGKTKVLSTVRYGHRFESSVGTKFCSHYRNINVSGLPKRYLTRLTAGFHWLEENWLKIFEMRRTHGRVREEFCLIGLPK